MKRFAFIASAILLIAGCANPQEIRPHHYGSIESMQFGHFTPGPNWRPIETLEDLEEMSANIVRGRMGDDARILFQTVVGHNFVSLEILEIIKGELNIGDIITIVEPYQIDDGVFFTSSNYMPSFPHQEYFFFLSDQIDYENIPKQYYGAFWVLHGEKGRFPVPSNIADTQSLNAVEFGLSYLVDNELYMRLWQKVINAYIN